VRLWLPALALIGCDFSAATATFSDSSPLDSAPPQDADADTDSDADTDTDSDADTDSDTDDRDLDDDGWAWDEGDCDDADDSVYPGALDSCDGRDTDCDDQIDEDAASADPYEPNDTDGTALGALESSDRSAAGLLHNDDDVDRFTFELTDEYLDFFTVRVVLSNIPDESNYRLTLNRLSSAGGLTLGEMAVDFSTGGSVELSFSDETGPDESGTYEAVVEAIANADCERTYLLTVAKE